VSVQAFLDHQRLVRELLEATPSCWGIVANSVHARAEDETLLAVFDTAEQAEAYIEASRLPTDWSYEQRNVQGRIRSFRPDSLLWDFNNTRGISSSTGIVVAINNVLIDFNGNGWDRAPVAINPSPPSGPMPEGVFAADAAERLGIPEAAKELADG
jgi:hypothetical protein